MKIKLYQKSSVPIKMIMSFLSLIFLGSKLHLLGFWNSQLTLCSWNKLHLFNVHHDQVEAIEYITEFCLLVFWSEISHLCF